jgi:serine/threonine protein kinase
VSDLREKDQQRDFVFKVRLLSQIRHRCCVSLISWDWIPIRPGISSDPNGIEVYEYLPTDLGRILGQVVKGRGPEGFGPTQKSCIAFGIALGMAYLHGLNIIHRDLKPSHILLDEDYRPRIAGFGSATSITLESAFAMQMGVGTPAYMAPEMDSEEWGQDDISGAADVFSFGMILWELASEKTPFAAYEIKTAGFRARQDITTGVRPRLPLNVTPEMRDLIERCWADVPYERPVFEDIVNDASSLLFEGADEQEYNDFRHDLVMSNRV